LAGDLPQTLLGKLTALPRPLAGFNGCTCKGREGVKGEEGSPLLVCGSTPTYTAVLKEQ